MPSADAAGVELYYVVSGSGVPCVVLHGGLGFDHTMYANTLAPLEDVCRMIYVDQRANGRSERAPISSIAQLAADVDALREALGLDRMALMGHSYGGVVSLEYAVTYPDRLTHLILLNTSPGVFEPTAEELAERPEGFEERAARAASYYEVPDDDDAFRARIPEMGELFLKEPDRAVLVEANRDAIVSAAAARRGFEILEGWTVEPRLDAITAPTLIAQGRYDLFCTPECGVRLARRISGAELVWFEGSGHFPAIEEPVAFFAAVRGWLARV